MYKIKVIDAENNKEIGTFKSKFFVILDKVRSVNPKILREGTHPNTPLVDYFNVQLNITAIDGRHKQNKDLRYFTWADVSEYRKETAICTNRRISALRFALRHRNNITPKVLEMLYNDSYTIGVEVSTSGIVLERFVPLYGVTVAHRTVGTAEATILNDKCEAFTSYDTALQYAKELLNN